MGPYLVPMPRLAEYSVFSSALHHSKERRDIEDSDALEATEMEKMSIS